MPMPSVRQFDGFGSRALGAGIQVLVCTIILVTGLPGAGGVTGALAPLEAQEIPEAPADTLTGPLSDLAIRLTTRGEFGGDWSRFRPCDASFQVTCNPGLVPRVQPDVQFSLESEGSVAGRLFIDVDYDQTRELSAANRFSLFYEGRPGELLQRVELGDVTFALPDSRFLTRGIPAGNFGFLAAASTGPVQFQTVVARQQGSRQTREFRLGLDTDGIIREDTTVVDDAGYVRGQFFFVVDPRQVRGHPHLDILNLRLGDAPAGIAPGPAPIQLWRMERDPLRQQQVDGYIQADAQREGPGGEVVREQGWWRYLQPGRDYYLHPSGLWVALRSPLRPDEALAVTYVAETGEEVGDYNPEQVQNEGGIPTLSLLRSTRGRHQPGRATWEQEIRSVYRLSGAADVDPASVQVRLSLGEESAGRTFLSRADGGRISLLRLFGLDESAPFEQVDRAVLFQPERDRPGDAGIGGTFLVFPTLRPFLEPAAVPSEGLTAGDARELLGRNANARIYEAEDPFEREGGALYRLNVSLQIRGAGVASNFSLGAFGIREGSERLYLGERRLQPGIDYILDPRVGTVTLLQPEFLLARSASDRLQVSWEQVSLFRPRPTTVTGGSITLPFDSAGRLDVLGLYQVESELRNRPTFGSEPGAAGMMGVRAAWDRELPGVTTFLERVLGRGQAGGALAADGEAPSGAHLSMEGELAVSLPNPNVSGDAYLDDFDAAEERTVSLLAPRWHLGSRPDARDGATDELPGLLEVMTAAELTWQHNWVQMAGGDSLGIHEGFLPRSEIDQQINVVGAETREPGLLLQFGGSPGSFLGGTRWRSITTLLSPTGADLSQTEFLDFYAAGGDSLTLIIDLGQVSEDAFFFDEEGRTGGFRTETGRSWGLGVLDQEADPLRGEIWNRDRDDVGVWPESCEAEPGRVYLIGDPDANCTRGNGRRDTEDLNNNGVLDTEERQARFVVRLDGSSPWLVRGRSTTGTSFRRYRIPIKGPGAVFPAGTFTQADWREVQFMRLTVAGSRAQRVTLARMRLVGSRWIKRGGDGIFRGLGGDTISAAGSLEVRPVGVLSEGAAYSAPPGVLEELDDPVSGIAGRGVEFSERALALRFESLGQGQRAEVYSRFLQRPRDLLAYRELRLWVVAREGDFDGADPAELFLKVGSDPDNFYLWRTRLEPAANPGGVTPADWLPERVIRFSEWLALRRRAEERLVEEGRTGRRDPVVEWSADSTYAVVLRDRARAPNLAAVREISMGVWNPEGVPVSGEVWINELRLGDGVRTPGAARYLTLDLDGGDLLQAGMSWEGRSPWFQGMEDVATPWQGEGRIRASGSMQMGGLLPEGWRLDMPLTLAHVRSGSDPLFLGGTDLGARELDGLRQAGFSETTAGLALRSEAQTGMGLLDRILSALDARVSLTRGSAQTPTSESRTVDAAGTMNLRFRPVSREVSLVPQPLEPLVRLFLPPGWARRLNEAEWRWSPDEILLGTTLRRIDVSLTRFDQVLETAPDDVGTEFEAPERWLESRARIIFRPSSSMSVSLDLESERDRLDPQDGVGNPAARPLVEAERWSLLGMDLGWETRRSLLLTTDFRPELLPGVRLDLGSRSRYGSDRDARTVRLPAQEGPGGGLIRPDDGPGALLRNVQVERELRAGMSIDPAVSMARTTRDESAWQDRVLGLLGPLGVSVRNGLVSGFFREDVDPNWSHQLGLRGGSEYVEIDGVRASTLVDRRTVSAQTGLRLPASFFLNLNLQDQRTASRDRRSNRDARLVSWPDIRLGASALPLPSEWAGILDRVSFTSGLQRVREDVLFAGGQPPRQVDDLRIPLELVTEWRGGVVARYRGTVIRGDGLDPTGRTERREAEHGVSLETRFQPGRSLRSRLEGPFQLSLQGQISFREDCRVTRAESGCVPFREQRNRSLSLLVNTLVSGFEVGGQASLVDRQSFTAFEAGRTQFQLGIWGRIELSSGPLERLGTGVRDPF